MYRTAHLTAHCPSNKNFNIKLQHFANTATATYAGSNPTAKQTPGVVQHLFLYIHTGVLKRVKSLSSSWSVMTFLMKCHSVCFYTKISESSKIVWGSDLWMTCNFTSFSTLFQSYQDNGLMIMKGCVQWNPIYDWKDPRLRRGSNSRPLDQ